MDNEWDNVPVIGLDNKEEDDDEWANVPVMSSPSEGDDWDNVPLDDTNQAHDLTREQILADPDKVAAIRGYMVERKGVNWETEEPDKLFDTYMSHMRGVNVNEMRTLSEALYVNRATPEQKSKAGAAYTVYDEMAPFWANGTAGDALVDYGRSILLSPSTYLGAVVGKGLVGLGSKAASTAVMTAAKEAAKVGGEAAGRRVISEALKVGAVSTAVDASIGVAQDIGYQDLMMDTGVQEEYSPTQTALTAALGLAGGVVGAIPELRKGSLGISAGDIEKSKALRKSRAVGLAAPRIKAAVQAISEQMKPVLGSGSMDWQAAVEAGAKATEGAAEAPLAEGMTRLYRGEGGTLMGSVPEGGWFTTNLEKAKRYADGGGKVVSLDITKDELMHFAQSASGEADELLTNSPELIKRAVPYSSQQPGMGLNQLTDNMSWFFDVDNPDSLVRIIVDSGADLKRGKDESFTEAVLGFMNDLPAESLKEINAELEPATGMKLGQLVDLVAAGQSRAGTIHNVASQASKYAENFAHLTKATKSSNESVINDLLNGSDEVAKDPEYAKYAASLWRRMIVSHPATTAVNVQGWGIAATAKTMAQVVNAGITGGMGLAGKAVGAKWSSAALKTSNDSLANQVFKAQTLLDPYETKEIFDTFLKNAPKKAQDKMLAETYGGVNKDSAAKIFGLNEKNAFIKAAEGTANLAANASLMHIQDTWTKTFSGIWELDLQSRKVYGKGIKQLVADGEYHKVTDEMWLNTVNAMAKDTFAHDYTKGTGALNNLASVVEKVSNAPYLGFLFPFGRFMNNNIAFTLQYSPIGFIPTVGKMKKLGIEGFAKNTDNIGEDISKAIVGTVGLATLIKYSMDARDQGKQWFEAEDKDGSITTEQNMAPISQYRLLARWGDYLARGEGIPKELLKEGLSQVGVQQWIKEITGGSSIKPIMDYLTQTSEEGGEEDKGFQQLLGAALQSVGGIASGFTRPLDPLNKVIGMGTETDQLIDRRQAEPGMDAAVQELTRYTDNIFGTLLGEDIGTPLRQATRPEGDVYNPNDMATMVGRKEVLPKNYTDKLLGMVDKPAYLMDQRTGSPQADRFMNKNVAPILNKRSKNLLNDDVFKNASDSTKRYMVDEMLRQARSDVRDMLQSGRLGSAEDRADDAQRMWLSQPEALRTQAKADLGIKKADKDLTKDEINLLRKYVGQTRKFLGSRTD